MNNVTSNSGDLLEDYNINIRVIALVVSIVGVILGVIFLIHIYTDKKQRILHHLNAEADNLEQVVLDDLSFTAYLLGLLEYNIREADGDVEKIERIFTEYGRFPDLTNYLGWRKFIWINKDFKEVLTSARGLIKKEYARDLSTIAPLIESSKNPDKIFFHTSIKNDENSSLKIGRGVLNYKGEYLGSVGISYDIPNLNRRLLNRRKYSYTNFLICDEQLRIIAQSKPVITNITTSERNELTQDLMAALRKIDTTQQFVKELSYLDMINGLNYYSKKIKNMPFILLINIDYEEIKKSIFDDAARKFIEIAIFASIFLLVSISIYRRESWLRGKAEDATLIANQATKAKSDFLAFTAHEIRSPLGFISTGSEIMLKELLGPLPSHYRDYVKGIHNNANIILDFITDILDETQILEGNFKIINSIASIEEIIEQAIILNKTRFNERKINIIKDYLLPLPMIVCDERRILQVISNLLSNAIKYSNDAVEILIRCMVKNNELTISISDKGIGMNEEEIKIALTKYGTVRKKNLRFIDSYGLGLPIVKMLLDAHEATLVIKSEVNKGTTVTIIFPKYKLVSQPNSYANE